jgi:poly(rC)-binding protein 2/3/4
VGDEAVLVISGPDAPAAAVRAWEHVVGHRVAGEEAMGGEEEEREVTGAVGCRMLAAGAQVGCVLGKGGKTVERMRQESGAQIRVFRNREQLPPCAGPADELIHVCLSRSFLIYETDASMLFGWKIQQSFLSA